METMIIILVSLLVLSVIWPYVLFFLIGIFGMCMLFLNALIESFNKLDDRTVKVLLVLVICIIILMCIF